MKTKTFSDTLKQALSMPTTDAIGMLRHILTHEELNEFQVTELVKTIKNLKKIEFSKVRK